MRLKDILNEVPVKAISGEGEREVGKIEFDSRKVTQGDAFVAVKGTQVDGHQFIDVAIANGATVVVCEKVPTNASDKVTWVSVANSQEILGMMLANYFGRPSEQLIMVGVTGTNGKTTSATMLYELFTSLGYRCGLISTIRYLVAGKEKPATHTTPDPIQIQSLLAEMVDQECTHCFMEVSSHALVQQRTVGISFRVAMFTHITHDHLDYHGTFAEYIKAKKLLFDQLRPSSAAIINADDKNGKVMVQNTRAKVKWFSARSLADYQVKIIENTLEGLLLQLNEQEAWFPLRGSFNAYNLVMVYAAGIELGLEPDEVIEALSGISPVEGRFQVITHPSGKNTGIVDYAHTPDALKNVLETISDINQGQSRIVTIVGCGGNRDKAKRPEMAKIAVKASDQVILTSDNPRNEEPEAILEEMFRGVPVEERRKVLRITNRREAIRAAVQMAHPGDILLVAGKGHETYQEIKGERFPFDDREELLQAFSEGESSTKSYE